MKVAALKVGTFKDSAGREHTFTHADLDKIVANYNPDVHEAPEVIGHPKTNAPAYGWVKSLEREGDILFYTPKDRVPEFQRMIELKMFKKRSVSLTPDLSLRHVGWLGATPPAVKGLPDVQFADKDDVMTIEFSDSSDYKMSIVARLFNRLRDFIISKFDLETAEKTLSEWELEALARAEEQKFAEGDLDEKRAAQKARAKKYGIEPKEGGNLTKPSEYDALDDDEFADPVNYRYPIDKEHIRGALSYWGMPKNREQYSDAEVKKITKRILAAAKKFEIEVDEKSWQFSEGDMDDKKIDELKQQLKAKEDELKKAHDALAQERATNRRLEFAAFCEKLIDEGRLTPVQKPMVLDFMEILFNAGEFEFVEGQDDDGKPKRAKKSALEQFQSFLSAMPKAIEFGDTFKDGKQPSGSVPLSSDEKQAFEKLGLKEEDRKFAG